MLVIKRYPNRKLYDTTAKQYITLEGIAARIRDGEEVQIVDHATGEDLTTLTRGDMERAFALSTGGTAAALSTVTIAGKSYPNSILRQSSTTTNPPDVDGYLARWNALVAQQNFSNGLVSLVITPTDPRVVPTPTLITAPIYRVRVVVEWNEEARRRSVVLDTTKIDRTK